MPEDSGLRNKEQEGALTWPVCEGSEQGRAMSPPLRALVLAFFP